MSHNKLDNFAKLHAFEFLNETDEGIQNGIKEIRYFIQNTPELEDQVISDEILVYFLRASKFQVDKVKKKIKRLVT